MATETPGDADYDPDADELLHDSEGNPIDNDYIDKVNREAEVGYALDDLAPARVGRPSLSEGGDSPSSDSAFPQPPVQKRLRLPLARERPSQLARGALETHLSDHRSA